MVKKLCLNNTDIIISQDSFLCLEQLILKDNWTSIFIIVDNNTRLYCLPLLLSKIPLLRDSVLIDVPPGEGSKSLEYIQIISSKLINNNIDRDSLIINLGGGVISDLGGFASAIIKRGVQFINIPTTLMAQVDASIGGKVAVNFLSYKNQIGMFNDPLMVFIYPGFLNTLSHNDFQYAFSEVFKYALVFDNNFWNEITNMKINKKSDYYFVLIRSIQIKVSIVKLDYFDRDERRKLNYGHTIAHAIESCFLKNQQPISHGLALSVGIICETYISYNRFHFNREILDSITDYVLRFFPIVDISQFNQSIILTSLKLDKKNSNGKYNFTLIKKIGQSIVNCSVSEEEIFNALDYYSAI